MRKIFCILAVLCAFVSCKPSRKALLPNVSGKAGEIAVVIEKADWEGNLGNEVRQLLASDCPYLVQSEPLYSLANVTPNGFGDLFKVHRNIFIINVNPQLDSSDVIFRHDVWAAPQCVIQVNGKTSADVIAKMGEKSSMILNAFEQAERDRVIANSIRYEVRPITEKVTEVFGGSPRIPTGYKLMKLTEDFAWIADEKQFSTQGIFVYRYPAGEQDPFSAQNIVKHRNTVLQANVPGMFENTYMTTSPAVPVMLQYLKYRGRQIAELRGYWEVVNDYMGGPFVSHSFYSPDGQYIIVAEAFVYAPKYDKRQYLRQTESIIYSWTWDASNE